MMIPDGSITSPARTHPAAAGIDGARRGFFRAAAIAVARGRLGVGVTFGSALQQLACAATAAESAIPSFDGATGWLNAPALTPDSLRGQVVLVQFCTYSCINWLRTLPHIRAWFGRYGPRGLVVIGVHTPEFAFERDAESVRRALGELRIDYPIALDADNRVWNAFGNAYWPALYLFDARGRLRHEHFGEGEYARSEGFIQRLLEDAGASGVGRDLVRVDARGVEQDADWSNLKTAETYVGFARAEHFVSPGGLLPGRRQRYASPPTLGRNEWALSGEWTVGRQATVVDDPGGRITLRFHARDLHVVMGMPPGHVPVRFRVRIDGRPPGAAHGLDTDEHGEGTVAERRLYQLVRQPGSLEDRRFDIEFLGRGVEAYSFTFG